jgi:hypothetical protein
LQGQKRFRAYDRTQQPENRHQTQPSDLDVSFPTTGISEDFCI